MITAIVLAGGFGTRLRSVVSEVPKPMAPVDGRPFLEYQLDYWINQGVSELILSVGYLKEIIINHFGDSYTGIPIKYSQEDVPLGTGGAVALAARELEEPFLLINGDTFFSIDLEELLAKHKMARSEWTFSLFRTVDFERYQCFNVGDDAEITPVLECSGTDTDFLANGGVYVMNPSVMANLLIQPGEAVSLEKDVITKFLSNGGKIYGHEFKSTFIDIGTPTDFARVGYILKRSNS